MVKYIIEIQRSLAARLILFMGITLFVGISVWAWFNIRYQKERLMDSMVAGADRLSTTIRLGTHYAMMLNARDDINQIINNIAKQKDLTNIRIYDKSGRIEFSNHPDEVRRVTNIRDEACFICHRTDPPVSELGLSERVRIFHSPQGHRLLGIISPIYNDPGCSTDACHYHPQGKKVLGALDVVVSLAEADTEILKYEKGLIGLAAMVFLLTAAGIIFFVMRSVNQPISKLIQQTRLIARGEYAMQPHMDSTDEISQLGDAINEMGKKIEKKQAELNQQRNEYQHLFEMVPCIVTVQDRNYRLLRYNREFREIFDPTGGDHCYHAYKGLNEKCPVCPVEKTFETGAVHYSEESGTNKDGSKAHWIVKTAPIRNENGEIVAAMEMSLDITARKVLEERLEQSEKKYYAIFNNIPNPVFVLDYDTLAVLDCNRRVRQVYGFDKSDMIDRPFTDLFVEEERERYTRRFRSPSAVTRVRQATRSGRVIFADIWVSLAEYPGQKVLLVITSDITERLETEDQLAHASKMATLGEMATGVAHELNQPLTVIKTASVVLNRKNRRNEEVARDVLTNLLGKIDSNVDRATKIINHMRQFARKSEIKLGETAINAVIAKAYDIFSQQLKVRGIEVQWSLGEELPMILADSDRLEQVFINLLINARDAIEEKWNTAKRTGDPDHISIESRRENGKVVVTVADTGTGIPESVASKIFEPFFTTKEVGKGTGLGLSISYGIVKDFGGDISVSSRPGEGACFTLSFPAREAP